MTSGETSRHIQDRWEIHRLTDCESGPVDCRARKRCYKRKTQSTDLRCPVRTDAGPWWSSLLNDSRSEISVASASFKPFARKGELFCTEALGNDTAVPQRVGFAELRTHPCHCAGLSFQSIFSTDGCWNSNSSGTWKHCLQERPLRSPREGVAETSVSRAKETVLLLSDTLGPLTNNEVNQWHHYEDGRGVWASESGNPDQALASPFTSRPILGKLFTPGYLKRVLVFSFVFSGLANERRQCHFSFFFSLSFLTQDIPIDVLSGYSI